MRDSTIFYRSFYESIQGLPLDSQAKIYNAIFNYSLNSKLSELSGIEAAIFTLIKPQLDANNKRYENGSKPKTNQKLSKPEAKPKQDISKTEANKNDNVNVNENNNVNVNVIGSGSDEPANKKSKKELLEERKLKFKRELNQYLNNPYSLETIKAFSDYWTEADKNYNKMLFEKRETFEIKLRLIKWANNDYGKKETDKSTSIEHTI